MFTRPLTLTALLLAMVTTAGFSQTLTEVAISEVAASRSYEAGYTGTADTSGTYYHPSMIQQGSTAFMFTQGGQFTAAASGTTPGTKGTSPVGNWCEGDKIVLWTNPLTTTGVTTRFTQKSIVSHCFSNATTRYHWGPGGAFLTASAGPVYLIANRTGVDKATGQPAGLQTLYLYEGTFNATATDFSSWTYKKLFDVSSAVGGIGCCAMAFDTTRTVSDGFPHLLFRGFGGYNRALTEVRMDFSDHYCGSATNPSSSPEACVIIEFKYGGNWRKVNSGLLDFVPDTSHAGFRSYNLFKRGTNLELWGSQIVDPPNPDAPCTSTNRTGAQIQWYTVSPTDFSLTGPGLVNSNVRPMPAEPAANRIGADLLVVGGQTYLFSSQNDDAQSGGVCTSQPFVGLDIVSTLLQ